MKKTITTVLKIMAASGALFFAFYLGAYYVGYKHGSDKAKAVLQEHCKH